MLPSVKEVFERHPKFANEERYKMDYLDYLKELQIKTKELWKEKNV